MEIEDIQRIDGLLVKVCETVDGRSPEAILYSSPRGFDTILNISDEDLRFLREQEAVTVKTADELTDEYKVRPEDCRRLTTRSRALHDEWRRLGEETVRIKQRLSWPHRLVSGRSAIAQREQDLREKEAQIRSVRTSLDGLSADYSAVAHYILTDKGVYVSLKHGIQRYVDLGFKPMQIRTSNSLNGRLVLFYPEEGEIWEEEGSYDPKQYGEEFKIDLRVPYEKLTAVRVDRTTEAELGKKVCDSTKDCIDTFIVGGRGPISVDYLDFPDRRFYVRIYPTLTSVRKDERGRIGTTKVCDYAHDDFHSTTDSRTVGLYMRTVEGEFNFDLSFVRVNSKGGC